MISDGVNLLLGIFGLLTIIGLIGVFLWRQIKTNAKDYDKGTIESLQNSVKALEIERDIYRNQQQVDRQEIQKLQNQVELLTRMVTAKDEIVRIETIVQQFLPLIAKDGVISKFESNDQAIMDQLTEIKKLLSIK